MRASTVSKVLLLLGALVGVATGVALAVGLRLDRLPPWMITVGMYKLAFLAAGGLFVAGALLGRAAQTAARRRSQADADAQLVGGSPQWTGSEKSPRQRDPIPRDRGNV